jgi:putative membrane protein
MHFILRLLVNAAALWVAVQIVPGITYTGSLASLLGVALVFGILNAVVRPLLVMLSLPLVIITLGLFTIILNALLLWLTSAVSGSLGLQFNVSGFWAAFFGAIVVSLVSILLSIFVAVQD